MSFESLIFYCIDSPINFEALESLVIWSPMLKKLRLNGRMSIHELYKLMCQAPQLPHLGTEAFNPDEAVLVEEQEMDLRSAFASLKYLTCLSGFKEMLSGYLPSIQPAVRSRVFPAIAWEDSDSPVSEVGLVAISEGCKKLRSILHFCNKMTNAAIVAMSKNCPDLVVFRLCIMGRHLPDHLTGEPMDMGFGAIVMNCKKFRRLAGSVLLTDKAFYYIGQDGKLVKYTIGLLSGLHHFHNMRFLWMPSCRLIVGGCKEVARRRPQVVVEVIKDVYGHRTRELPKIEEDFGQIVEKLYMYRSLDRRRSDAPNFVTIL
ncbi:hypothetical protein IFM89_000177 [Coptis chinensis]|uniref:Uncharacterized protein n=1 Tax=Coptis chinensis TaxID=261450 RepID=A0A835M3A1_9MAGN|nr:hypothetical protein IFM89_000177 [Coptis chinensis]